MMSGKTVMVVEDDHETRVEVRRCLEEAGYFVVSATNGAHALELLSHMTAPQVILLDINMPIMNGDLFLHAVRAHSDFKRIPIVQMSAATSPRREGTLRALSKPIHLDALISAIEECCTIRLVK